MFLWLRNNKAGLPYLLLRIHDLLVRDTIKYFEKGGPIRRKNRQVRKALNKAMGIARKNKRNPGVMLGTAVNAVRELSEEVERTRKALRATYDSMEEALRQIEKERIQEPIDLIEKARDCFEKKDFKQGMERLRESKEKMGAKVLMKTRTALFCGISGEVKDLKWEIDRPRKGGLLGRFQQRAAPANLLRKEAPHPREEDGIVEARVFDGSSESFAAGVATIET